MLCSRSYGPCRKYWGVLSFHRKFREHITAEILWYLFKYTNMILHYKTEHSQVRMRQLLIRDVLKDSGNLLLIQFVIYIYIPIMKSLVRHLTMDLSDLQPMTPIGSSHPKDRGWRRCCGGFRTCGCRRLELKLLFWKRSVGQSPAWN